MRPKALRLGEMRDFITIKTPTETVDDYGQPVVSWANYLVNEPAKYSMSKGVESVRGTGGMDGTISGNFTKSVETQTTVIFTVRYRDGYTTSMQIEHGGKTYGICAIFDNWGRRYLELHARST
jgi:head-tail adaptor